LLGKIFPETKEDPVLAGDISANICANLLGLGNAATPLGIRAAKGFCKHRSASASDSLCRLVVLNTASIQLIPTTVAAIRASLGCQHPFDILPAVWITSFLSAGLGLAGAVLLGKVYSHD
jgi:spore maturation protein A